MENIKEISVSDPTIFVEDKGFVDLGLSSGILWCTTNEYAQTPNEKGIYGNYGILEIGVKEPQNSFKGRFFYNQIPGSRDLPTSEEMEELLEECIWERGNLNGTIGMKVIGPNGNSIFLPLENIESEEYLDGTYYLSSSIGWPVDEDSSMDAYAAVSNASPIVLNINIDRGNIEKDLYISDFGNPTLLLRTVIPQNRKIKRDELEDNEKPEFFERNPKAAVATEKRFIGKWDE